MKTVYCIKHPKTDSIVYIGVTGNIKNRESHHNASSLLPLVKSIVDEFGRIKLTPLENCEDSEAMKRERFWIQDSLSKGYELLNKQKIKSENNRISNKSPKWKFKMENLIIGDAFETDAKHYNTMRAMRSVLRKKGFDFQFKLGKGKLTVRRTA